MKWPPEMYDCTICTCSYCQPVGCADEYHLFYNMTSFLWKGVQLEPAMGGARYALLLAELWLVSGALLCALFAAGAAVPSSAPFAAYYYHSYCAVGFSAVLFGLKTILYSSNDRWQEVHLPFIGRISTPPRVRLAVAQSSREMTIEFKQQHLVEHDKHVSGCIVLCARRACAERAALRCAALRHLLTSRAGRLQITAWVELLAVQLVTPNASLVGHLAGVLAGAHLLYFQVHIFRS
jgi:Rhomboid family